MWSWTCVSNKEKLDVAKSIPLHILMEVAFYYTKASCVIGTTCTCYQMKCIFALAEHCLCKI